MLLLVVTFALIAFGRGVDYTFSTTSGTRSLLVLEALAPLRFWGTSLMGGGLALLVSLVFRIQAAVWAAHVFMAALNVCMFISITQSAVKFDGGFSESVLPLVAAVWHGVFVFLSNPFRHEEG